MKMSRHLKKREKNLLQEYSLLNESIHWWETEINESLDQIDLLENKLHYSFQDAKETKDIMNGLRVLLGRIEMERRNMDRLEDRVNGFLHQKKIIKNAPFK